MKDLLLIAIKYSLVSNVVLSQFLGICPFLGVSKKTESSKGMGGAVIFVIVIASVITHGIYVAFLTASSPLCKALGLTDGLEYLNTIVFILVIAALVQFVEMFLKKNVPSLYESLGVYLPLITTNCAVLGVALLNVNLANNLIESVLYGFGAALGFSLVLVLFATLRERLAAADVPKPFQGASIALVTAGLMSLAFMGFTGLVKI